MNQRQIGIDPDLLEVTIVARDLESDLRELGGFELLCEELNDFSRKAISLMGFKHQVDVGAGQLKVAIIGDFSAGKSSLINSLIGEELCPVNAKPTTSSLSRFRWGSKAKVFKVTDGSEAEITFDEYHGKVQHGDDGTQTSAFEFVVEYPYDALRDLEIIDTPGFGNSQNDQDTALTIKHAALADVILYLIDIPYKSTWVTGVCQSDAGDLFAVGRESRESWGFVLHSSDGGSSWRDITPRDVGGASVVPDLSRCATQGGVLMVAGANGLFGSLPVSR